MPHSVVPELLSVGGVVPELLRAVSCPAVVGGLVRLGSKCGYAAVKHSETLENNSTFS